jgi:Type IV pilin-like G and H, putative
MDIPPESKQKSSTIPEMLVKLALASILLSPVLFILQQFFVFVTYDPEESKRKNYEAMQNLALINKMQVIYVIDNGVFAKTFNELAIGTLQGGNIDSSEIFEYKLNFQTKDIAIIGAKPIDKERHGFNGAVLRYKNRKGFLATKSIVCKSVGTGVDGTNSNNLPAVNTLGHLTCAPNWKVLYENNNREPSDQESPEQGERT